MKLIKLSFAFFVGLSIISCTEEIPNSDENTDDTKQEDNTEIQEVTDEEPLAKDLTSEELLEHFPELADLEEKIMTNDINDSSEVNLTPALTIIGGDPDIRLSIDMSKVTSKDAIDLLKLGQKDASESCALNEEVFLKAIEKEFVCKKDTKFGEDDYSILENILTKYGIDQADVVKYRLE